MIAIDKHEFVKSWMAANETSMIKRSFFDEHLPRLKPFVDYRVADKQPKLHSSPVFPPIVHSVTTASVATGASTESPVSIIPYGSTVREEAQRFISRYSLPTAGSSLLNVASGVPPKRTSLYSYVQPKINTGLPRTETIARSENNIHRLGPTRPSNWRLLAHELDQDKQIRAQAKRIQFGSGVVFSTQLKSLANLVRAKVKSYVSSVTGLNEGRYKIVVHLTVFEAVADGLYVASRCLWNTLTDNSVTIKMQAVDCNILIVVFLCYTDCLEDKSL